MTSYCREASKHQKRTAVPPAFLKREYKIYIYLVRKGKIYIYSILKIYISLYFNRKKKLFSEMGLSLNRTNAAP